MADVITIEELLFFIEPVCLLDTVLLSEVAISYGNNPMGFEYYNLLKVIVLHYKYEK